MPRTTQCENCGVILNIPDRAVAGKRLRCPKCGFRFAISPVDASSDSTLAAPLDAEAGLSSYNIPSRLDDLPMPIANGDLREAFDLPLTDARNLERAGAVPAISEAEALFRDDASPRRRTTAADARARARRCSNCGGLVPQGMSICVSCGVDQETGMRVGLEDDLAPPPPPRPSGPPIHIAVTGGLLGVASMILLLLSLIRSVGGGEGVITYGWLCLAIVSGFALYAVVQFIRLKSAKLLMVALTLGAVINVLTLVIMPLAQANFADAENVVTIVGPQDNDPDSPGVQIKPLEDRINTRRITLGISFLILYALLSVYLMSPAVKRPMHRASAAESW